jgi:hypothetical protein
MKPGQRTGKFRMGNDQLLVDPTGKSEISVQDYAVAMIDELERPAHVRLRFTVGYWRQEGCLANRAKQPHMTPTCFSNPAKSQKSFSSTISPFFQYATVQNSIWNFLLVGEINSPSEPFIGPLIVPLKSANRGHGGHLHASLFGSFFWIKIIDRNRKSRRDEMVLSLAPRALVL